MRSTALVTGVIFALLAASPRPAVALEDGLARAQGAAYWRAHPTHWDALLKRCAQMRMAGLRHEDDCKFAREVMSDVRGTEAVPGVAWWSAHSEGLSAMLAACGPLDEDRWSNRENASDCKVAYHSDRAIRGLPANPWLNIERN